MRCGVCFRCIRKIKKKNVCDCTRMPKQSFKGRTLEGVMHEEWEILLRGAEVVARVGPPRISAAAWEKVRLFFQSLERE